MQMQRSNSEADMSRKPSFLSRKILLLAGAIATLAGAAQIAAQAKPNWQLTFSLSAKGGHIVGNPASANKIVEYASYTCGHCAEFEEKDAPLVKAQLVATGNSSFEIRNLVRDPLDLTAAMLARCGGKGRFFGRTPSPSCRLLMANWASTRSWPKGALPRFRQRPVLPTARLSTRLYR
jgi:protein-disulfide isomerase